MSRRVSQQQLEQGAMALATALVPLTDHALAQAMGVAHDTARRHRALLEGVAKAVGPRKDEEFAEHVNALRFYIAGSMADPEGVVKASLKDKAIALGILDEHWRLASNKATSHIHVLHEITSREQLARRLMHLLPDVVGTVAPGDGHDERAK